jgi:amino acid adenylation domain-containing protein
MNHFEPGDAVGRPVYDPAYDPVHDRPVHDLFSRQSRITPDAVALVGANDSFTYRELEEISNGIAKFLTQQGIGVDTPVALNIDHSAQELISLLATLKAGGAYIPLHLEGPAARSAHMIADASCRHVLGDAVPLELPTEANLIDSRSLMQIGPEEIGPQVVSGPDDLVYILFTSGSTGKPKGVAMRHGVLANLVQWQIAVHDFRGNDRVLKFSATHFDVSAQEIFSAWLSGACLVLAEEKAQRDPDRLIRQLREMHITRLFLPFVALRQLAQTAALRRTYPEDLREVYTAGEQLYVTAEIREFFARTGATLHNQYGPTETHVVTEYTLAGAPESWPERPPIGYPIPGAHIEVVDENGISLPPGVVGELAIAGDVLARGYVGMPELTSERFTVLSAGQRRYRTGDLGRVNSVGVIEFVGRADRQIKVRGYRVEPGEIEKTLLRHPQVSEAVVDSRDAAFTGQELTAWIVKCSGAQIDEDGIRRYCSNYLPDYMVPRSVSFVEEMPLTSTGKVDRRSLGTQTPARRSQSDSADATEKMIVGILADILDVETIEPDEDFFDLGIHSVTAVTVALKLSEFLNMEISSEEIFDYSTTRELALRVGQLANSSQE